ncbi:PREDICTED: C-type lectin domain family 5 member A [Condylura cristata]|uniref:C-type lectin domain family 5 member A n=1 Tax=Condylura cristata TaxID=143302 RepID=UPI0006435A96|nr:PREDICTED: C-type lectin domain family 5 member A [Condylura cristata]
MNWHLVISGLIVMVLKIAGMTLFLLYFPKIFGESDVSITPTGSSGTVCPQGWDFHEGRCFFLSASELSWNKSRDFCEAKGSTLAIVNKPEKLTFLQDITGAEKYFIGLLFQQAEKKWRWINKSMFTGNVTNERQNFNCLTIGLTTTYDAASCDISYRWICEKAAR